MHLYDSMKNVQYKENRRRDESGELGRGCSKSLRTGRKVVDPPEVLYEQSPGPGSFSFVKCEAYPALGCGIRAEAYLKLPSLRKSV